MTGFCAAVLSLLLDPNPKHLSSTRVHKLKTGVFSLRRAVIMGECWRLLAQQSLEVAVGT